MLVCLSVENLANGDDEMTNDDIRTLQMIASNGAYDETADVIQNNMNRAQGVSWRLNSVQYEDDTNMIHYEWEFEVV